MKRIIIGLILAIMILSIPLSARTEGSLSGIVKDGSCGRLNAAVSRLNGLLTASDHWSPHTPPGELPESQISKTLDDLDAAIEELNNVVNGVFDQLSDAKKQATINAYEEISDDLGELSTNIKNILLSDIVTRFDIITNGFDDSLQDIKQRY